MKFLTADFITTAAGVGYAVYISLTQLIATGTITGRTVALAIVSAVFGYFIKKPSAQSTNDIAALAKGTGIPLPSAMPSVSLTNSQSK